MFVVNYGSAVAMFSLAYFLPTLLKAFEYDVWLTQLLTGKCSCLGSNLGIV